ncbi:MAG: hypothetical protein RI953_172 [Pseudomonadota bacterium]|jgi:hypothetical protein
MLRVNNANSFMDTIGPKHLLLMVLTGVAISAVVYLLRQKEGGGQKKNTKSFPLKTPGMPNVPNLGALPSQKAGGQRKLDEISLSPESQIKRAEAQKLVRQGQLSEAALVLESINLQREAIDILETNGLLDDAAAMLMRMNRPNRAGVIYERNKRFEHAAIYFLKAKLVEDAKRCCRQIKSFNLALSVELSVLFAEAGDNKSAIRLLADINDRTRILKIVREKFAYNDLAEFLDFPAARQLLLGSLIVTDVEHMLQNMPEDANSPLNRALLWINESKKPEWLTPIFAFIGDNRGVASKFIEKVDNQVCDAFGDLSLKLDKREFEQHRQTFEWIARGFHDTMKMLPAAKIYERLKIPALSGKCWAIAGNFQKALAQLTGEQGDLALAGMVQQELNKLGRYTTEQLPLSDHERDSLSRLFFNIDPDTEKNRADSPFSIAS